MPGIIANRPANSGPSGRERPDVGELRPGGQRPPAAPGLLPLKSVGQITSGSSPGSLSPAVTVGMRPARGRETLRIRVCKPNEKGTSRAPPPVKK